MKVATMQCAIYYGSKVKYMTTIAPRSVRREGEVPIARFQRHVLQCHIGILGLTAAIHTLHGLCHSQRDLSIFA